MEFRDYYKILGISKTASQDEIRKAFRQLARKYHPDVAENKAEADTKFKEINEAYEVLRDPDKRRKYDELGSQWNQAGHRPPPQWQRRQRAGAGGGVHFEGTGFSDFFESFFSGGGVGGSRDFEDYFEFGRGGQGGFGSSRRTAMKGSDVEGDLMVPLDEAVSGTTRDISLRDPSSGNAETVKVRIPGGVRNGQRIRVAGRGNPSPGGGPRGDLLLRVRIAQHPTFRIEGGDLYVDLELAPWEAALGASVKAPTLNGSVTVKIPAGTCSGKQLRVRGKGLPATKNKPAGDLYLALQITVPSQLSDREREVWEQLREVSEFNPREG